MDEPKITIARWGSGHAALVEALMGAHLLGGRAQEEDRAGALYDALGIVPGDDRYRLVELRDGRWALLGMPRDGERFAVESAAPSEPITWRAR